MGFKVNHSLGMPRARDELPARNVWQAPITIMHCPVILRFTASRLERFLVLSGGLRHARGAADAGGSTIGIELRW